MISLGLQIGPKRATHFRVTQTNTSTENHPLWTLVLAGLDDIKKQENDLENRRFDLSDANETDRFQLDLERLSTRTDRVNRMLDAMGSLLAA